MKILGIRIKNLASLEGITEIDFTQEPLQSAGIFAITGPTGAGKSTILDALCLALYGKTPRYLQAKESGIDVTDIQGSVISQGDVRGILRDGTGEGYAEVDFIGVDGQSYSATWRIRRARDKAEGSLQAYTVALKNINTNADIPGKKTELLEEIERLIGLNFEQFTRSVLLAQGEFTSFLKAVKDEKSALLEKLTGTHIYSEISKQVFENYRKEERLLEDLNLQRQGIVTLTTEEIGALGEQQVAIGKNIELQEKEVAILTSEIAWHLQLSILQSNLTKAQTAHEEANENKKNAALRQLELKLAEQVQPARTFIDGKLSSEKQLAEKVSALQQFETIFHDVQQQKEDLNLLLQSANADLIAKTKKQEEAKPLLEEAKGLDFQIKEKTEQVTLAANALSDTEENYKEQEQQLRDKQEEGDKLHSNIEELKRWKAENTPRQPIAENQSLIISKLGDARKLLDSLQLVLPLLEATQSNIGRSKKLKLDLDAKSSTIIKALETERVQQTTLSNSLSAIPFTTIEREKTAIDLLIEDIVAAEAHWKVLYNSQTDLLSLKQKIGDNKKVLQNKVESLVTIVEQLVVLKAERDSSLRMLDKARLAAAENVESLRSRLIPGDPCPVCGNTEHPYATNQPELNHVLQELEKEQQKHETAYTTGLAIEHSLRDTSTQLNEIIAEQEKELNTRQTILQEHQRAWEKFTIYKDVVDIPNEQKAAWLAEQLQTKRTKQKELQTQIQLYTAKKQELDKLQNHVNDLEKQLNENSNAVKDAERNLQSLNDQLTQFNNEQSKTNKGLSEIEQNLKSYFVVEDWFSHWKKDPEPFLKSINDFTEKWKTNNQKLEEDIQQHSVQSATLNAAQEQLQAVWSEVEKKRTALDVLRQQYDSLLQKRITIFNGEDAVTIELGLNETITAAQQALEKIRADWDTLQIAITRNATQKEQTEKDIATLQKQVENFDKKVKDWLTSFNTRHNLTLDMEKLEQLLTLSTEWIETERAALRTIDDAITTTLSVMNERNAQLLQHEQQRISEREEDELNGLLNESKVILQQNLQQKNEIGFRLQQDAANKQTIGKLLGEIETQALIAENWAKLNEIIGSSDGKKFRQIAQEYTLDVLLSYANVHLEMLSKRYLLQRIPNTLGLQVLDQDMGDEIRTVFSLSGGESFLVSLALALGLASLSSSRMQVESLFIDEGFGSLDPTTLNIAMDALERLHNQGRKVGVISHVQEMTERIPVQIKVSKQNSGRSKVEVIGV